MTPGRSRATDRRNQPKLQLRRQLDALDDRIVALLRENGRQTNQDVANQLGVSEATIRKRVRELTAAGVMRIVAITDPHHLGLSVDVTLAIQVHPGHLLEVVDELAALDEISYIGITTGPSDILAAALFHDNNELIEFLSQKLGAISGISKIETTHTLRVAKRSYDWIMPR